jgi:hypothetical protein
VLGATDVAVVDLCVPTSLHASLAIAAARAGGGIEGLVPTYPWHRPRRVPPAAIELIHHARQELGLAAARTRLWLQRVHGVRLTMGTIQRVFRDLGCPDCGGPASGNRAR